MSLKNKRNKKIWKNQEIKIIEIEKLIETKRGIQVRIKIEINAKIEKGVEIGKEIGIRIEKDLIEIVTERSIEKMIEKEEPNLEVELEVALEVIRIKESTMIDEPNAPGMNKEDTIPLREVFKSKFTLMNGDLKKSEILLDKKIKATKISSEQQYSGKMQLIKKSNDNSMIEWNPANLYYVDCTQFYQKGNAERSGERQYQRVREATVFQVFYFKEILIPSDPTESDVLDVPDNNPYYKRDLSKVYSEWRKQRDEIKKQNDIAKTLNEMLAKNLFQTSPEMVFKVLSEIKYDLVETDQSRQLGYNLINIWNTQIQSADFQFYSAQLQQIMMQLNQEHQNDDEITFGKSLFKFYQENSKLMILEEERKRTQNMLMQIAPKHKNFRTVPCKLYHGPHGFCNRGDMCNFIHEPRFKGYDIPRDDLLQIRNENMIKYRGIQNSQTVSQMYQSQAQQGIPTLNPTAYNYPPELTNLSGNNSSEHNNQK